MNLVVESYIASRLQELDLEKTQAYVNGKGSLAADFLRPVVNKYSAYLNLIRPEDFETEWVKGWFRTNRPDLWQIFSTPEGEKWLERQCVDIRLNLIKLRTQG